MLSTYNYMAEISETFQSKSYAFWCLVAAGLYSDWALPWASLWYYTGAIENRPCSPRAVLWQSFQNPLSQNPFSLKVKTLHMPWHANSCVSCVQFAGTFIIATVSSA